MVFGISTNRFATKGWQNLRSEGYPSEPWVTLFPQLNCKDRTGHERQDRREHDKDRTEHDKPEEDRHWTKDRTWITEQKRTGKDRTRTRTKQGRTGQDHSS